MGNLNMKRDVSPADSGMIKVFAAGRVLQLDNYRKLTGYGWTGFGKMILWRQDKRQKACSKAFT
jgi:hypothetical protein